MHAAGTSAAPDLAVHLAPPPSYRAHPAWPALVEEAMQRLTRHGDLPRWLEALGALPELRAEAVQLSDRVGVSGQASAAALDRLRTALAGLHPWRKGPFELFGVHVDTEWRSDWKWRRIAGALGDLSGERVLDVGCGNGYFGWRLLGAGAAEVLGVDPSVLFFLQHLALCRYLRQLERRPHVLLPLPFESLPEAPMDLVLSMGVVYHRPDPDAHVRKLCAHTRPGGRVLVESLIVEQTEDLVPGRQGRYARMRNVSIVPRLDTLVRWLEDAGLEDVQVVDVTPTTPGEQRRTPWMTFESLAESLDPEDPTRTVEGHPAPVRAALLARRP